MKAKLILILMGVLGCVFFLNNIQAPQAQAQTSQLPGASIDSDRLFKASVKITMFPSLDSQEASNEGPQQPALPEGAFVKARGLGTLVLAGREVFIITHNHWGDTLDKDPVIEVRAADNELLARLSAAEFTALIRHQDPGTLVLKAPQNLARTLLYNLGESASGEQLAAGKLGNNLHVQPGDIVQVARRTGEDREEVEVIDARVLASEYYQDLPILTLQTLNGELLEHGDSGGGVWFDGELIGNMWARLPKDTLLDKVLAQIPTQEADPVHTDLGFAASLPSGLDQVPGSMVQAHEPAAEETALVIRCGGRGCESVPNE
jgi:hypothetical protein